MQLKAALFLLLASAVSAHDSSPINAHISRRHHALLAARDPVPGNHSVHFNATHLHKRGFSGRASWYDVGLGACGGHNVASDLVVALNAHQYGSGYPGPECFKHILITYNGKTVGAEIVDECPGCPPGGLDMSKGLFQRFTGLGTGIFYMTWTFAGGGGGDGGDNNPPPPKTTHKSTTTHRPTSTSHHTQPSSTEHSTSSDSTTHTHTTRTHTTTSSTSASSTAAPTAPAVPPGNLGQLEQAIFDLAALLDAAVPAA